jgi:DNA-binding NarL/FixJ family response regulator
MICTLGSRGLSWRHPKVPGRWNLPGAAEHRSAARPGVVCRWKGRRSEGKPATKLHVLQHALDAGHPGRDAAVQGIVEPLTSRELEVLAMLAAGRSNQAIARELVVSLDTVKKHVSHVLGKLGAANRTEAVARARRLGLIP